MTADLTPERLDALVTRLLGTLGAPTRHRKEAADAITALRAEVERLTLERDTLNALLLCERAKWDAADARADAAEADAAAARKEVRKLQKLVGELFDAPRKYGGMLPSRLWNAALAALQGKGGGMTLYRLLERGDVIQPGDESLCDDCETWEPIEGWTVGVEYNLALHVPMRRRMDREPPR